MIKLKKIEEPQVLVDNGKLWTETLVNKAAAGEVPTPTEKTRYRNSYIKEALVRETSGKCAYCESKLQHIHHGDVEHIMPKSLDLSKILEWEHLTLACEICNQNKSNLDPNSAHIIDPYTDDPRDHLAFTGSMILSKGTEKGTCSRTILDLNRGDLMERRQEKLAGLTTIAEIVFRNDLPLPARRAMFANLKTSDACATAAYSAMSLAFVDQLAQVLPGEVTS